METDSSDSQNLKKIQGSQITRRTFIKASAGTVLYFGVGPVRLNASSVPVDGGTYYSSTNGHGWVTPGQSGLSTKPISSPYGFYIWTSGPRAGYEGAWQSSTSGWHFQWYHGSGPIVNPVPHTPKDGSGHKVPTPPHP